MRTWHSDRPTRHALVIDGFLVASVYQPIGASIYEPKSSWIVQILNYTHLPRSYATAESAMKAAEREAKKTIKKLSRWAK